MENYIYRECGSKENHHKDYNRKLMNESRSNWIGEIKNSHFVYKWFI